MKITKSHIPGAPKIPYAGGKPTMIIAHETANQKSTIDNEAAYVKRNWRNAFYHYLVSDSKIIEVSDPRYVAWGAGAKANPYGIHVELVRNNGKNFKKAYQNYVELIQSLAKRFDIPLRLNHSRKGVVTHHWVSRNLGGTDHTDPDAWLKANGVSIVKFSQDLRQTKPKEPTMLAGKSINEWHRIAVRNHGTAVKAQESAKHYRERTIEEKNKLTALKKEFTAYKKANQLEPLQKEVKELEDRLKVQTKQYDTEVTGLQNLNTGLSDELTKAERALVECTKNKATLTPTQKESTLSEKLNNFLKALLRRK